MVQTNNFKDFKMIRAKRYVGIDGREKGGFYELNSEIYMIKKPDLKSIINEFVGSHIARLIIGENAPVVTLLKGNGKVYTASKFIPNFKTLQEFFLENDNLPRGCFPYSCVLDKNDSITIVNPGDQVSELDLLSPVINGAEAVSVLMELIAYNDPHHYNRGIIVKNDGLEASLVDYGQCFMKFPKYKNYIRNLNKKYIISAIEKVSSLNFQEVIENLFIVIKLYCQDSKIDSIKESILEMLLFKQESLRIDKDIMLLTLAGENNHRQELYDIMEHSFYKIGEEIKFKLCLLFKEDRCKGIKSPIIIFDIYDKDKNNMASTIVFNKPNEFKQIFDSYLSSNVLAALGNITKVSQKLFSDLNSSFKQIVIYNRTEVLDYILSELVNYPMLSEDILCPNVLNPLLTATVTYNRTNSFQKLLPITQQFCGPKIFYNALQGAYDYAVEMGNAEFTKKMNITIADFSRVADITICSLPGYEESCINF